MATERTGFIARTPRLVLGDTWSSDNLAEDGCSCGAWFCAEVIWSLWEKPKGANWYWLEAYDRPRQGSWLVHLIQGLYAPKYKLAGGYVEYFVDEVDPLVNDILDGRKSRTVHVCLTYVAKNDDDGTKGTTKF